MRIFAIFFALVCLVAGSAYAQDEAAPTFDWSDNRAVDEARVSPNAVVGTVIGTTKVMIAYGSPGVKGREIFGDLVPFGELWRSGANEATTITFSDTVLVEGNEIPDGTYSLFTIPGEDEWTIVLNADGTQWGGYSYDESQDVLRFNVAPFGVPAHERLTFMITDVDTDANSASVVLAWDTIAVAFGVAAK
jgi:hypothetical protein